MKVTIRKSIAAERLRGRAAIADIYAAIVSAAVPSPLYAVKTTEAERVLGWGEEDAVSPLLQPEAIERGISTLELARLIRTRADQSIAALGAIEAKRQKAQSQIDAATTAAQIDDIINANKKAG